MTSIYDRVTACLYPFSGLSHIDPEILANAAERGTKVHEICDAMMNDIGVFNISDTYEGYINSFTQWIPGKKFVSRPSRFYCDKYYISGEIDGLYKEKDGYVLFDIKTPARESKTWMLQGSAYSYLAKQAGFNIIRIEFIKLDKTGKEPKVFTYKEDFNAFVNCLEVYRYFYKTDNKENYLDFM